MSCEIEFLDFLQPTIAMFYMAVPSELGSAEYLCRIIKLHPLQEILLADLDLGGDIVHSANHSSFVTLQAMQIR